MFCPTLTPVGSDSCQFQNGVHRYGPFFFFFFVIADGDDAVVVVVGVPACFLTASSQGKCSFLRRSVPSAFAFFVARFALSPVCWCAM